MASRAGPQRCLMGFTMAQPILQTRLTAPHPFQPRGIYRYFKEHDA
jgi:hypothetical protein